MEKSDSDKPYVAIFMVTYNHEKFIEQAIESVMMQEASFKYKLFIAEDCSTDNTRALCIKMKQKYPDKIELILNERNLGQGLNAYNLQLIIKRCGAKFAAILDGDDYWIDPQKIQKQVDILDTNEELSLCFTRINVLNDRTGEIGAYIHDNGIPDRTNFARFIESGRPHNTCSVLYKLDRLPDRLPDWFAKTIAQDWTIYVILLLNGDAWFLDEITAVYRVHDKGVIRSTSQIRKKESSAFAIVNMAHYCYPKHQEALNNVLTWTYFSLAFLYLDEFSLKGFFTNMRKAKATGERKTMGWYWYTCKKIIMDPTRKIYHKILG